MSKYYFLKTFLVSAREICVDADWTLEGMDLFSNPSSRLVQNRDECAVLCETNPDCKQAAL